MKLSALNITLLIIALTAGLLANSKSASKFLPKMILISGGYYLPLFKDDGETAKEFVKSFYLDSHPITNAEYLEFVKANSQWRKSKVKRIFADANYLREWKGDLELGKNVKANDPVCNVSWFAANAYSRWAGKRLPTVSEWEFAFSKNLIDKIEKLNSAKTFYEWTFDFNESNFQASSACGGAGSSANDPTNYAAFLRFSFRNSLKPNYCLEDLGFRCASGIHVNIHDKILSER